MTHSPLAEAPRGSARRLIRSVGWNMAGVAIPAAIAIAVVPVLVRAMGVERFGVLSLAWVILGYLGLMDLGLGRALTRKLAELLGQDRADEVPGYVRAAVWASAALGCAGGLLLVATSQPLVEVLNVPTALRGEAHTALVLLAFALPFVLCSSALAGVLEAHQRFDLLNLLKTPASIANFVVPAVLARTVTPDLGVIVGALALARALYTLTLAALVARRIARPAGAAAHGTRERVAELLDFGKWLTVSNLVSPLMEYFDRFVVSSTLGAGVVAYYTVPYDVLSRTLAIPAAIAGVVFPLLTETLASTARPLPLLFRQVFASNAVLLAGPLTAAMVFAPELLGLWVGPAFAGQSAAVARVIALGVMLNAFARMPYVHVQAEGRADWLARMHLLMVVPYFALLAGAVSAFGILGAAMAWLVRIAIDMLALYAFSHRLRPELRRELSRELLWIALGSLAAAAACALPLATGTKLWITASAAICALLSARQWACNLLKLLSRRAS